MKKISRVFLFGALSLVLVIAACAPEEGTPTVVGPGVTESPPALETATAGTAETTGTAETQTTGTAETETTGTPGTAEVTGTVDLTGSPTTDTTLTPGIPVTGDVILLECQFCIEDMGNALLVIPETSTLELVASSAAVSSPDLGCSTVDTFNGRQVVLCRGEENTEITVEVCLDGTNCTQVVVTLQACPVTGTPQPGNTETPTPAANETDTPTPADGSPTPTPADSSPTPTP